VHARIAPLLARAKRWQEARRSFDAAGVGFLKVGFADKAIAIWKVAAKNFPEDVEYWERVANEQVKRGRKADAVQSLLEGREQLTKKAQRSLAMTLLRQVLTLDAFHFDATLDLAKLLAAEGQRRDAEKLLREMRMWVKGRNLRRLRAAQFRLSPSWRALMDWILGK
jgi:Tfp pilus assembly protein PilF